MRLVRVQLIANWIEWEVICLLQLVAIQAISIWGSFGMNSLIVGNFDFEHELASPRYQATRNLQRLNAELSCHLMALAATGDFVCLPEQPEHEFVKALQQRLGVEFCCQSLLLSAINPVEASNLQLIPWGWSEAVRRIGTSCGVVLRGPEQTSVRMANSRRASVELERELGLELKGSRVLGSLQDFHDAVDAISQTEKTPRENVSWVVKAEFGMSARERVVGRGALLQTPTLRWLEKRLAAGEWLVFEPWLDRVAEFGILFWIHSPERIADGAEKVERIAVTKLLTDATGRYVGSTMQSFQHGSNEQAELLASTVSQASLFVSKLAQRGYFGPIGIDAMLHRNHKGELEFRPIQDVNARCTMGFIARRLTERLSDGRPACWLLVDSSRIAEHCGVTLDSSFEQHVRDSNRSLLEIPLPSNAGSARAVRTSPVWLGDQPTRQVGILLTAESDEELNAARELLVAQRSSR